MFVFDSLNALKTSTEIVAGVLYRAPDKDGALITWEVQVRDSREDTVGGYRERCTGQTDLVIVNQGGFFSNDERSQNLFFGPPSGTLYFSEQDKELFIYLQGVWASVSLSS